jgi:phosphoribosylaminoimidazole carboxylase (NCAIR synthetase)
MPRLSQLAKNIPSAVYLYALLGVAVIGAYQGWAYHQREIGKREMQIVQYEHTNRTLRQLADSLAKQYRVDTVRFRVIRTQVDTLTQAVENWKTDTLKVVEYVAKADTAIKACSVALATCEQRVGVAERGWKGARDEIAVLKASFPSKARPWLYGAVGVGAGYLAGRVIK